MFRRPIFIYLFLQGICLNTIFAQPIVNTGFGQVQGKINGTVSEFLGVPYASPPVGNLRWKAPEDPVSWTGVLPTIAFDSVCPQKRFEQGDTTYVLEGDEDCLYLNIWTPQTALPTLPVMVFIHGGGNQQGSASQISGGTPMFYGKNMAERGNAVVVTIQYRLGPLAWLVHPGLEAENQRGISGNYGTLDQIKALDWIKKNIPDFGGDTTKVMIFGESAGGVNVGNLMISPLAKGLFHRAVIQSAIPNISPYDSAMKKGISFVDRYITTGTNAEKIGFMRSVPADSMTTTLGNPMEGGIAQMAWQPVLDHYVFTGFPQTVIQSGNYNKVPLIIGSNADESSLSAPATVYPFMVNAIINKSVPAEHRSEGLTLYPPGADNAEARNSYIQILTDAQFTSNTRRTAQCIALSQEQPVWRYFFSHKHTLAILEPLGSYHGMELFYVFNNWENALLGQGVLFKPADAAVQTAMLKYWANFAATGNPNGTGLVAWPEYQAATDCYLDIKANPDGNNCGLRKVKNDFWDKAISFIPCTPAVGTLKEGNTLNIITAYPNPVSGILNFNLPAELAEYGISIYDNTGRLIHTQKNHSKVDFTSFPDGIYHGIIDTHTDRFSVKIAKTP